MGPLRAVYTECLRLRHPLTPMMDENGFYIIKYTEKRKRFRSVYKGLETYYLWCVKKTV